MLWSFLALRPQPAACAALLEAQPLASSCFMALLIAGWWVTGVSFLSMISLSALAFPGYQGNVYEGWLWGCCSALGILQNFVLGGKNKIVNVEFEQPQSQENGREAENLWTGVKKLMDLKSTVWREVLNSKKCLLQHQFCILMRMCYFCN